MSEKEVKYGFDMMPLFDWDYLYTIEVPQDRWFTDEEFDVLFKRLYHLTPENIEKMKKFDRDNGFPDRFSPEKNDYSDNEINQIVKNTILEDGLGEESAKHFRDYLTGKISSIELIKRNLNLSLYENREAGRKRYPASEKESLIRERKARNKDDPYEQFRDTEYNDKD